MSSHMSSIVSKEFLEQFEIIKTKLINVNRMARYSRDIEECDRHRRLIAKYERQLERLNLSESGSRSGSGSGSESELELESEPEPEP